MARQEILERIRSVVSESATIDIDLGAVSEDTTIADLGFDSLAVLDLLFDLEQEFGIQITAEEIQRIVTVGELITFLQQRMDGSTADAGRSD
ncbi:MAG: phosphopantetheine-binding protein [bacterium]|nr:phosphopantetheine-binding protein [bacterium]